MIGAWPAPPVVIWHDIECGAYRADLPLWRELAAETGGPILDVGAGAGRVALDLAHRGHAVTALDRDPVLLGALAERADAVGLHVPIVVADAQDFALDARFALIAVPMQTIQLLDDRLAFLCTATRHLAPGGLLAVALADELEPFAEETAPGLPAPDVGECEGWRFASQPVAVRELGDRAVIERVRTALPPGGDHRFERDTIELANVSPAQLEAEAVAAGLHPAGVRQIAATPAHVGTTVVLLHA